MVMLWVFHRMTKGENGPGSVNRGRVSPGPWPAAPHRDTSGVSAQLSPAMLLDLFLLLDLGYIFPLPVKQAFMLLALCEDQTV